MSSISHHFSWQRGGFRLGLASASPRRLALLRQVGLLPEVLPVSVDETPGDGEPPAACVTRLALAKARAGLVAGEVDLCLGADTVVVVDDTILGKPRDPDHAREMLARLSGRSHHVWTGIAVCRRDGVHRTRAVVTEVTVKSLTPAEIAAYVATGEPLDKAGGYGLQGLGAFMITRVAGSCSGVIGLPLGETLELVQNLMHDPDV